MTKPPLKELLTPRQHEIASFIAKGAQPTASDDLRKQRDYLR